MFFSVITINYNNCSGIKRTIESVLSQNYDDFEYIVIDGGSTDGGKEIIESNLNKIDFYVSEKDSGVYDAMNKGWKNALGRYCIFLNSGDIFANSDVLSNVHSLVNNTSDIVYGCHLWGSVDGERWNPKKDFKFRDIMDHTPISHQATFIKKSLLVKVGGFKTDYIIISDWGVLIDSLLSNAKLQKISLDVCIADEAGVSNVTELEVLKERQLYLFKHHFIAFIINKYIVLPIIRFLK